MEIVQKPSFQVMGMKITCTGDELSKEMPALWERFRSRVDEIPNRLGGSMLDICLQKVGDEFTQMICVPVGGLNSIPDGMESATIPEQRYVNQRHTGPEENIEKTFGSMIEWAEANGHQLDPLDFKIDIAPADPSAGHDLYLKVI